MLRAIRRECARMSGQRWPMLGVKGQYHPSDIKARKKARRKMVQASRRINRV